MEWQTDPLLREEIEAVRAVSYGLTRLYQWDACAGVSMLMWKGEPVGAVYPDGRYWLRWRRQEHGGTAATAAQARRFMMRWLHAHRHAAPLLEADLPPPALTPLLEFLREYDEAE